MMIMKPIYGPFVPDPNVSTAVLSFDDKVWCLVRELVEDERARGRCGVVELRDVRVFRCRARHPGTTPDDVDFEIAMDWWALELEDSDFARNSSTEDSQRESSALSMHRHFVVRDGNHRAIDIFAREAVVHILNSTAGVDFNLLFEDSRLDEMLSGLNIDASRPGDPTEDKPRK